MKFFIYFCCATFLFLLFAPVTEGKTREDFTESGEVIWDVQSNRKMIAITFDDGPHPIYTPLILDVLKKHNAKATFFVIGKHAERYPDLLMRQVEEGHEIGNHTYEHVSLKGLPKDTFREQLLSTEEAITNAVGVRPVFFRPTGGYYDDRIIDIAADEGYRTILWSWHQDSRDWKRPGVNAIVNNVTPGSQSGDIVLLHDAGGNRTETVKALDTILKELGESGFEFVTISELLLFSEYEGVPPELIQM